MNDIIIHNQKVAYQSGKEEVAKLWGDFYRVLSHREDKRHDKNRPEQLHQEVDKKSDWCESEDKISKEKLFQYFEKNPIRLKQEVEEKNIIYRNNIIYLKKNKLEEYQTLCENMLFDKDHDLQQDQDNEHSMVNQSLVDSLQQVIDSGQLQQAFIIYRVFKENGYPLFIPEKQLKVWSMAYIELLRNNGFYIQANQCIKNSSLDIIKDCGKKHTLIYFSVTCHKCLKQVDLDSHYQCTNCKTQALCAICQEPLNKGLLVWCQQCSHATHARETKQWFLNNQECPTGCGHKCFNTSD